MKHAFGVGQNITGLASVLVRAPAVLPTVKEAQADGYSFEHEHCHKGDGPIWRMGKQQPNGAVTWMDVRAD